jgi:chromosomal replication initiation ATPase DnaA
MQTAARKAAGSTLGGGDRRSTVRFLESIVACAFDVPVEVMRSARRGPAPVAFTRQVAIYLAHTRLGLSFSAAGALFHRDRTTAAHACRTVEDCRDNPRFDKTLDYLERTIDLWSQLTRMTESRHDGV